MIRSRQAMRSCNSCRRAASSLCRSKHSSAFCWASSLDTPSSSTCCWISAAMACNGPMPSELVCSALSISSCFALEVFRSFTRRAATSNSRSIEDSLPSFRVCSSREEASANCTRRVSNEAISLRILISWAMLSVCRSKAVRVLQQPTPSTAVRKAFSTGSMAQESPQIPFHSCSTRPTHSFSFLSASFLSASFRAASLLSASSRCFCASSSCFCFRYMSSRMNLVVRRHLPQFNNRYPPSS
mmetsp:Transcript_63223/g.105257  ORF Transcript_63223/g.105257 Transcript_63223/m.105257 type:complete len:242 (-) Transcript_63223:165-890(-)